MNKLTIIRGLPGSGVKELAEKLSQKTGSACISFDKFFDGIEMNFKLIKAAHQWCFGEAFFELSRGCDVIVYGEFCEKWNIGPFVETAQSIGVEWTIVEPTTKHKFNVEECSRLSGRSMIHLQNMLDKWETTSSILKSFEKYCVTI